MKTYKYEYDDEITFELPDRFFFLRDEDESGREVVRIVEESSCFECTVEVFSSEEQANQQGDYVDFDVDFDDVISEQYRIDYTVRSYIRVSSDKYLRLDVPGYYDGGEEYICQPFDVATAELYPIIDEVCEGVRLRGRNVGDIWTGNILLSREQAKEWEDARRDAWEDFLFDSESEELGEDDFACVYSVGDFRDESFKQQHDFTVEEILEWRQARKERRHHEEYDFEPWDEVDRFAIEEEGCAGSEFREIILREGREYGGLDMETGEWGRYPGDRGADIGKIVRESEDLENDWAIYGWGDEWAM